MHTYCHQLIDTAWKNALPRKWTDNLRLYFGLLVKGAISGKAWSATPFPTTNKKDEDNES
jgi:hypothetical protein